MVQENSLDKIIIICGPTASGKTALAVECAKLLNSEVISADSMYIYKGLDIGTAKPTDEEKDGIVHHLIDVANPSEHSFTVSDYKRIAEPILLDMLSRGKTPIVCGGTGFYINSLIYDLSYGKGGENLVAREKYKALASQFGNEHVYKILADKDPDSAERLHYNDIKRVIRALEIYENGFKKSELNDQMTPKHDYNAYFIDWDREVLYKRINERVDFMVDNGLIDEVKSLLNSGIKADQQCMQGIGYKETIEYLNGNLTIDELKELIKLNTRHYAKRQLTFFRRMPNLTPLPPDTIHNLAKRIIRDYDRR
ncbi:MAG: tRNA (adenosine(37)-N6)-dimethylallyltransferase MiaA [Clostridia bacterium]|nr:tRNA (adenosine(37)-N6)-dimethylallyltransferase MiaA [Clostridia bacterium]